MSDFTTPPSGLTLLAAATIYVAATRYGVWCAIGFLLIYWLGRSQ